MRFYPVQQNILTGRDYSVGVGKINLPGFNPHPALLPGDAPAGMLTLGKVWVSIHTRHCCRVMLLMRKQPIQNQTFQSTPGIAAG